MRKTMEPETVPLVDCPTCGACCVKRSDGKLVAVRVGPARNEIPAVACHNCGHAWHAKECEQWSSEPGQIGGRDCGCPGSAMFDIEVGEPKP